MSFQGRHPLHQVVAYHQSIELAERTRYHGPPKVRGNRVVEDQLVPCVLSRKGEAEADTDEVLAFGMEGRMRVDFRRVLVVVIVLLGVSCKEVRTKEKHFRIGIDDKSTGGNDQMRWPADATALAHKVKTKDGQEVELKVVAMEVRYKWAGTVQGQEVESETEHKAVVIEVSDMPAKHAKGLWRLEGSSNLNEALNDLPEGAKGYRTKAKLVVQWSDGSVDETPLEINNITVDK